MFFLTLQIAKIEKKIKIFNFFSALLVTRAALFIGGKKRSHFLMEMNKLLG
jgi:hypothetical protein